MIRIYRRQLHNWTHQKISKVNSTEARSVIASARAAASCCPVGDFFNSNIACLSDFLNACKLRQQKVGVTFAVAIHHLMDCCGCVDAVVTLAWFGSAYTIAVIGATSLLPRPITAFVSALGPSSCFHFVIWSLPAAPFCCVDTIAPSAFYCELVMDIVFLWYVNPLWSMSHMSESGWVGVSRSGKFLN